MYWYTSVLDNLINLKALSLYVIHTTTTTTTTNNNNNKLSLFAHNSID